MADCIFCKINDGSIPSLVVYEDERVRSIMDINPTTAGHILLISKRHAKNILDTDDADLTALTLVVKKIAPPAMQAVGADSFNLIVNNGAAAGQIIDHVHWHLIPRRIGDGLTNWPGQIGDMEELGRLAEIIRSQLA